jgi:hypothetical protein
MNTTDSGLRELVEELVKSGEHVRRTSKGGMEYEARLFERAAKEIESFIAAAGESQSAAPAGMVLVPREPTEAMLSVGTGSAYGLKRAIWKAMIDATQIQPLPMYGTGAGHVWISNNGPIHYCAKCDIVENAAGADEPCKAAAPAAQVAEGLDSPAAFAKVYEPDEYEDAFKGRTDVPAAQVAELADVIVPVPDGAWLPADITPDPSGADETGSTTGLALYIEQPNDGGPNIRQGRYDHPIRTFIDSTTAMSIYPDLWSSPAALTAALKGKANG